jgi:small-conductance mechanosensitive channel
MKLSTPRALLVGVPAAVLALCLAAALLTRGAMEHLPFLAGGELAGTVNVVDQRPFQTAAALAPLAISAEEQAFAREAERLADHEVDQAFAMALRQATLETRVLTGGALELQQKMTGLQQLVKEDQAHFDLVNTQVAALAKAANPVPQSVTDDLDVAKAQLQLDTDELNDASDDLARESGDQRSRIQQELTARQGAMKKYDEQVASGGEVAVLSSRRFNTLAARVNGWWEQRSRRALVEQAQRQAEADIRALTAQHAALDQRSTVAQDTVRAGSGNDLSARDRLDRMAHVHALAQVHSILDDRLQTERQLSGVYTRWSAQIRLQHRIVRHLILQSLAGIAGIILGGVLVWWGVQTWLDRSTIDPRREHTLRTIATLSIELVTLLLVLLIVFGPPGQLSTILGLVTGGLAIVFQNFILAFFGWFVLMGRNGIRVGDWVEINGVGGEVVEIGLFRTALLETGNWTDKGHPTGRRVTFMNNFAVSGQYFNFSTAGQWMWDQISINVPAGGDTHKTIEAIHAAVVAQTEAGTRLAEAELQTATQHNGLTQFSATPSVDMRPAASGIDIIVRYITRAADRFETRNRVYQTAIELLHRDGAVKTIEPPAETSGG